MASLEVTQMQYSDFQKWMNLIGLLKYGLFFSVLLLLLPVTAFEWMFGHSILGSLFLELKWYEVFLTSTALFAAWWSLMFTEGLIVDGVEGRFKKGGLATLRDLPGPTGYIPKWSEEFFNVPVTPGQFFLFTGLAVVGVFIIAARSSLVIEYSRLSSMWALLGFFAAALTGLLGGLVAYLTMLFLCLPAVLADPSYRPLPDSVARGFWARLSFPALRSFSRTVHHRVSGLLARLHIFRYLIRDERLLPDHYFALTNVAGLLVVTALGVFLFSPVKGWLRNCCEPASSAYLFVLVVLLIWLFAGVHFHLARLRISPLAAVLAFMVLSYSLLGVDHYFYLLASGPAVKNNLTPVDIAGATRAKTRNLVVVATSGGGIYASGWTALALRNLVGARPQLKNEIRLISGISGGSVATAFYVDGLLRHSKDIPPEVHERCTNWGGKKYGENELNRILGPIYERAVKSSLSVTAYGFAFLDFWRFATGGILPFSHNDRGTLLEQKWPDTAAGIQVDRELHCRLSDLSPAIEKGVIPSFILATTVNENGRRVMVTPIDFPVKGARADTLWEYLEWEKYLASEEMKNYLKAEKAPDMSLWTAARLSATFSYVSPSARMEVRKTPDKEGKHPGERWQVQGHHFIDGGYYDNYGVTSALDWLQPVVEEVSKKEQAKLDFERILIIELRAFPKQVPAEEKPLAGWKAALLGPVAGILAIRDTVASTRNAIDIERFKNYWNERFQSTNTPACIKSVVFVPKEEGPLSWHLTPSQIESQMRQWSDSEQSAFTPERWNENIKDQWDRMDKFLNERCSNKAVVSER